MDDDVGGGMMKGGSADAAGSSASSAVGTAAAPRASLAQKVVLITGASAGIGAAIAKHFSAIGYRKLVLVARRKHKLEEVSAACRVAGATDVLVLSLDLADMGNNAKMVNDAVDKFGRLDVLINNVGILPAEYRSPARSMPVSHFEHVMRVNTFGPFVATQTALPHLEVVRGAVVFVASIYGSMPVSRVVDYNASKAAMKMMARIFALEEAPRGVRVNIISPGHVATDIIYGIPNADFRGYHDMREVFRSLHPLGRMGEVEDIARLAAFVVSDADNQFMTGSDIVCDGGRMLNT